MFGGGCVESNKSFLVSVFILMCCALSLLALLSAF